MLTAAHCVVDTTFGLPADPASVQVLSGTVSLTGFARRTDVAEIIVNSSYNRFTRDADIALLRLSRPINNTTILPVAEPADGDLANLNATILGWGSTDPMGTTFPTTLQQAEVTVLDNRACNRSFRRLNRITGNMICASSTPADVCRRDDGGPLVVLTDGQLKQAGITSFGNDCANRRFPAVFTRVSEFSRWIEQNTP
ncbi:MAG: serine protease [Synechococcaceae cyanobacterium SM2_3_1]|nr:serine protease [Synechococcaceae cyanobacterium SM2_3_1]